MNIYPKCYYADEKITVLENIVLEKGYEMLDRAVPQDFDGAK